MDDNATATGGGTATSPEVITEEGPPEGPSAASQLLRARKRLAGAVEAATVHEDDAQRSIDAARVKVQKAEAAVSNAEDGVIQAEEEKDARAAEDTRLIEAAQAVVDDLTAQVQQEALDGLDS